MAASKKMKKEKPAREKTIPEYKLKLVVEIAEKIKKYRTLLIASTKGLPSSQFHEIKKSLRGKAEIKVAKKSLVLRAIKSIGKGTLQNIKDKIGADIALFFSNLDPFELSSLLADNQSSTKAKTGDIAPEDINVEPGPTDLLPGPAISELSGVGLKVAVESGKLAIKQGAIIANAGEIIKENVASVMAKLNIKPMKVGFEPLVAYDSQEDKLYVGIKIDKKNALEELRDSLRKAFGFAVNIKYTSIETIKYFIVKAGLEEKAIENIINKAQTEEKAMENLINKTPATQTQKTTREDK